MMIFKSNLVLTVCLYPHSIQLQQWPDDVLCFFYVSEDNKYNTFSNKHYF